MANTLDYAKFIGDYGRVLGEEEVSAIFERKIYSRVTEAITEQSLRGKLILEDHTTESYDTDILDLVEWPDDMAGYGGGELNAFTATIGLPSTTTIKTEICYAKGVYGIKAENNPDFAASKDEHAFQQLIKRENYEIVNSIYTYKANAVTATTTGTLCFHDLVKLASSIGGNGGAMTNIVMNWAEWEKLLDDPDMLDFQSSANITTVEAAEGSFWDIPAFRWTIVVSRHATAGTIVAWDRNRYMTQAFSMPLVAAPFDEKSSGRGIKEGTAWFYRFGCGTNVNGTDFVAYMTP
jgi:hypothetical protein